MRQFFAIPDMIAHACDHIVALTIGLLDDHPTRYHENEMTLAAPMISDIARAEGHQPHLDIAHCGSSHRCAAGLTQT